MGCTLEGGVDTKALELSSKREGIVQSGEGITIVLCHVVVLVDHTVFIDILILDVAHFNLSELLHGAVVNLILALEESQSDESALCIGRTVNN